jgi:hypothetical protein
MNYIFTTPYTAPVGQIEICAWTEYNIDMQHNNDTTCVTTTILDVEDLDETESKKKILKITDLLGQAMPYKTNTILFYIYDDGTVEKRIVIE